MHTQVPQNRLAEAYARRGLTVTEVAAACGVYPTTIKRWEAGEIPQRQLPVLGRLLDVDVAWLTGWSADAGPYVAPTPRAAA